MTRPYNFSLLCRGGGGVVGCQFSVRGLVAASYKLHNRHFMGSLCVVWAWSMLRMLHAKVVLLVSDYISKHYFLVFCFFHVFIRDQAFNSLN